jgi:hypothetical protein
MKIWLTILILFSDKVLHAQLQDIDQDETQQQNLETLSESTEAESEDEYFLQQLVSFKDHPLNINGPAADLNEFPLLEPLQIENILKYRGLLGDFISVYELQSVPGFTTDLIRKILPFITIADSHIPVGQIKKRFTSGSRSLVFRPSMVPEIAKGFSSGTSSAQKYQGGRGKIMARYTYKYRDLLQYGIVADQDAGEKFALQPRQPGFDFYSIHLFARKMGIIKALALGDYTVNLGQGLIHWQSQAYNKSADVINVKRQSETLRPYHSAGEFNFLRGIGMTLKRGNVETTLFASYRKISANIEENTQYGTVIASVQTSGLHRTLSEIADKNASSMMIMGGTVKWQTATSHIGLNAVQYKYSLPLLKRDQPYNLFSIKGRYWANYSGDYSFTYRNYHVFGEFAVDKRLHSALLCGMMATLDPALDIAILFRSIGARYQSLYGNAFTENTLPSNERGIYIGVTTRPATHWKVDLYADLFRFPWLRYRADAPGFGSQFLVQADWRPSKGIDIYSRFRFKLKPLNEALPPSAINYPQDRVLKNWRTHASFQASRNLLLRSRIELCWYGQPGQDDPQAGFLLYADVLYKPFGKACSISARFQVFETDGYDTRLYAYENDVLFSSSIPAFSNKGARLYINFKTSLGLKCFRGYKLNFGLKVATSVYSNVEALGSGQDEIEGKSKSEIRFQAFFSSL